MPNSLTAFTDWVAMEALRVLKNKLSIAEIFDTSYIPEFKQDFAIGQSMRIPLPQRYVVTSGTGYQPQPIDNQTTTATIDMIKGVHFAWNSFEQATTLQRGDERMRKDFVEAPMTQIAQEIESRAGIFATNNTNNIVGTLGVNPTSMTVYNQARARLVENGCPPGENDQRMIISPGMQVSIGTALSTVFNPQGVIGDVFNDGVLGRGAGFGRWYESMSVRRTTADTWASTVEVTTGGTGGSTLTVTCTTGDTFTPPTVFSIEGVYNVNPTTRESTGVLKQFVITQTTVGAGGSATITFSPAIVGPGATPTEGQYQNVSALPATGADLTMYPGTAAPSSATSGVNGLAINKQAFALVGVQLPIPASGPNMITAQKRDPKTGLSVSFIRWYDGDTLTWKTRYDVAFGFGALYPDNCAVRVLSLT